jgi:hypothetical protein
MPRSHTAARGESVESVAYAYGHFWETVWDDPANAELREERVEPNVLAGGDVLVIPDLRPKEVTADTGRRHVFRRRGVPSVLRVRLLEGSTPRAGLAYTVEAGGKRTPGKTDADGWVEAWLMPDVQRGELRIDDTGETYAFQVGTVSPVQTPLGVQTRLRNLGYFGGRAGSTLGAEAVEALRAFQRALDLPATGEPDEATLAALVDAHGS